jgi:hypothetical protein
VFEETARGTIIRIVLAAILYVIGAAGPSCRVPRCKGNPMWGQRLSTAYTLSP